MSAQKQKNKKTKKTKKKTYFKKPKNLTFNSSSFELLHIIFHGTTMAKPVNFFP